MHVADVILPRAGPTEAPQGDGESVYGYVAGPLDAIMPSNDLGQIFVGQLQSGDLYALPASYYSFDLGSESTLKPCATGDSSCTSAVALVSQAVREHLACRQAFKWTAESSSPLHD